MLRDALSPANICALVATLPIFYFYFSSNQATSGHPFRFDIFLPAFGPLVAASRLLLFWLVEFGAFALVIAGRNRRSPVFWIAVVSLLLAPMFRLGRNMDFAMRASIPGLFALSLLCIRFLLDALRERRNRAAAGVLATFLLIGAVTPYMEFKLGAYRVMKAGHMNLIADPFGTVLHPDADTFNFICRNTEQSFFYRTLAK